MKIKAKTAHLKLQTFPVTIGLTTKYSVEYLETAAFFARKIFAIERIFKDAPIEKVPVQKHRRYFFANLNMAFASVEANLNEIIYDKHQEINTEKLFEKDHKFLSFENKTKALFKDLTKNKIENGKLPYKKSPYKNVIILKELRNSFVHFRPVKNVGNRGVWNLEFPDVDKFQTQKEKQFRLEYDLKALKFGLNPWYRGNPFYPNEIISHGCSEWAVETAFNFISYFRKAINVGMDDFKGDFSTR